ncbi:MAG: hypothetical protein ACJ756_09220, partial [Solirubrobacterales bacterium]
MGLGALALDVLDRAGPDRLGLLLGEREDVLHAGAEVAERDRGIHGGVPAQLGHLVLHIVHLGGERLHLGVGLVALAREGRDFSFHLSDVSVDLASLIATQGYVETGLRDDTISHCKQLTAVRHDSILTRKVPSRSAYTPRDGT